MKLGKNSYIKFDKNFFNIFAILVLYLSVYEFAEILVIVIAGRPIHLTFWVYILVFLLLLIFGLYWYAVRNQNSLRDEFRLDNEMSFPEILTTYFNSYSFYIIVGTIFLFFLSIGISIFSGEFIYTSLIDRLTQEYYFYPFLNQITFIFFVLVIAPFFEEFFFRYLILRKFEEINGNIGFIIAGNSILFIIVHFPLDIFQYSLAESLKDLIFISFEIGIASIFFSYLFIKTRKLIYPILGHFLWNLTDFIFFFIANQINAQTAFIIEIIFSIIVIFLFFMVYKEKLLWNKCYDASKEFITANLVMISALIYIITFIIVEVDQLFFAFKKSFF